MGLKKRVARIKKAIKDGTASFVWEGMEYYGRDETQITIKKNLFASVKGIIILVPLNRFKIDGRELDNDLRFVDRKKKENR